METPIREVMMSIPAQQDSQRRRYQYSVLQKGSLPLKPNRKFEKTVEHRCTTLLLWPENAPPGPENTLLIDPCFTATGYQYAQKQLKKLNFSFSSLGFVFITHRHIDHLPNFPQKKQIPHLQHDARQLLRDIELISCPGHAKDLRALVFRSTFDEQVWVVGDAILNLPWLKAWQYYWPNAYTPLEVVQTWNSVAKILARADIVIPGHGDRIDVTAALLTDLLETFPTAEYASECLEVEPLLRQRQQQLLQQEAQKHASISEEIE